MGDPFVRPGIAYTPHIEHLVLRHPGTGTSVTTKSDWLGEVQKDTLASIVAHPNHLLYISIAEGVSTGRMKQRLLDKMNQPLAPLKRERVG